MKTYTEEEKLSLLRQYPKSGLSKTAFSRRHDLCVMNLRKWLRKYGNPDLPQIIEEMKKHDIPSGMESLQEELIALRKELRQAEKLLKGGKAEEHGQRDDHRYGREQMPHPFPKKLRCQVISTLSQSGRARSIPPTRNVRFPCGYLGISRQGYSKHKERHDELDVLRKNIVLYCNELGQRLPRAGMRQLYELCRRKFGEKFTIGREQCYDLFRSNGLILRVRKCPRTTCSNYNYFIYPDQLNTTPKLKADRFGRLCVTDA